MDEETREALKALGWISYRGCDHEGNEYIGWQRGTAYFHVYHEALSLKEVKRPINKTKVKVKYVNV